LEGRLVDGRAKTDILIVRNHLHKIVRLDQLFTAIIHDDDFKIAKRLVPERADALREGLARSQGRHYDSYNRAYFGLLGALAATTAGRGRAGLRGAQILVPLDVVRSAPNHYDVGAAIAIEVGHLAA